MATIQEVQKSASWYHAVTEDNLKYARYDLQANRSLVWEWLAEQGLPVTVESVQKAFHSFEHIGVPALAVKPDVRLIEEQAAKRAADEAAETERQRLADIAAENHRYELVEYVSQHRGATTPHALAVEKSIVGQWPIEKLEQEKHAIELRQQWRGKTAAEFKAGNFAKVQSGPGPLVLPADLTRAKFKAMQPFQIRLLVKSYVTRGHSDRAVWAALNALV